MNKVGVVPTAAGSLRLSDVSSVCKRLGVVKLASKRGVTEAD